MRSGRQKEFYIFATYDAAIVGYESSDEEGRNSSPIWKVENEECAEAIADALAQHFNEDVTVTVTPVSDWPLHIRLEFGVELAKRESNYRAAKEPPEEMDPTRRLPFEMTEHAIALHDVYKATADTGKPAKGGKKPRHAPQQYDPRDDAKIVHEWEQSQARPDRPTRAEFEKQHGLAKGELERTQDRHRKRQGRAEDE